MMFGLSLANSKLDVTVTVSVTQMCRSRYKHLILDAIIRVSDRGSRISFLSKKVFNYFRVFDSGEALVET
jgi:hypothetical protein